MNNFFQIKKLKIQWYNSSDFCPLKDIFPPFGVISPFRRLPPQDFFPHLGVIPSFRSSFPLLPLFTEKNFASWMETFLRLLFEMIYIKAVADLAHLMKSNREPLSIHSRSFSLAKNNCPPPPLPTSFISDAPPFKKQNHPVYSPLPSYSGLQNFCKNIHAKSRVAQICCLVGSKYANIIFIYLSFFNLKL